MPARQNEGAWWEVPEEDPSGTTCPAASPELPTTHLKWMPRNIPASSRDPTCQPSQDGHRSQDAFAAALHLLIVLPTWENKAERLQSIPDGHSPFSWGSPGAPGEPEDGRGSASRRAQRQPPHLGTYPKSRCLGHPTPAGSGAAETSPATCLNDVTTSHPGPCSSVRIAAAQGLSPKLMYKPRGAAGPPRRLDARPGAWAARSRLGHVSATVPSSPRKRSCCPQCLRSKGKADSEMQK